jgi:hypothetical protein
VSSATVTGMDIDTNSGLAAGLKRLVAIVGLGAVIVAGGLIVAAIVVVKSV